MEEIKRGKILYENVVDETALMELSCGEAWIRRKEFVLPTCQVWKFLMVATCPERQIAHFPFSY